MACCSGNWVHEWDWADRLTKVTSNGVVVLQNWYDANSRRIAKQEIVAGRTEKWLYLYDGWDIIGVMDAGGQLVETYTRGVGLAGDPARWAGLVAVTHYVQYLGSGGTPATYYLHHNHRGDIVLARNGPATITSYAYSAFGELTSMGAADVSRFKFSSKERDPSTGFSYYGYRFYSPQLQRWISRDPIGEEGGVNLYEFVQQDPINRIDLFGQQGYKNWDVIKCQQWCDEAAKLCNCLARESALKWCYTCCLGVGAEAKDDRDVAAYKACIAGTAAGCLAGRSFKPPRRRS